MAGYTPGEQPKPGERVIKLNTNENPFPPSPRVVDAIRRLTPDALRRYPSSMADEFRAVAARVHGVSPENILAGNGSDDILQIALRKLLRPRRRPRVPGSDLLPLPGARGACRRSADTGALGARLAAADRGLVA